MNRLRPISLSLVAAAVALSGGVAHAQSGDSEATLRRAVERCRRGDFDAARGLFEEAFRDDPTGHTLGEMGMCAQREGRWVEAEGWLDAALATDDPWVRRRRGAIEESLTEVRRHLGRVLLTGAPEGAEVRIGGRRAGTLPMSASVRVAAGLVELEVRAEGHLAWRQMVEVLPGASFERAVTLEALQAPEAPPPAEVARCAAGMEMRRGLCYPVAVRDPDAPGRPWRVVGFVGVGLAAVSAGLAVALGLGANSTEADYQARCGGASVPAACLEDWVDTQASLDTRAGLINTFWVLTGVGATLGAVGFGLDARATGRRIRAGLSPRGATLGWTW